MTERERDVIGVGNDFRSDSNQGPSRHKDLSAVSTQVWVFNFK